MDTNTYLRTIMFQMRSAACPWTTANVKTAAAEHACADSTLTKKPENANPSSSPDVTETKIISRVLKIAKLDANLSFATW